MPAPKKPMADWPAIQARYEAGESAMSIERDANMPTHSMISRTARKQGWVKGKANGASVPAPVPKPVPVPKSVPVVALAEYPDTEHVALTGISDEHRAKAAAFLTHLTQGRNMRAAASLSQLGIATVYKWQEDQPAWKSQIERARWTRIAHHENNMESASDRGDVKATLHVLRSDEWSRERWGDSDAHGHAPVALNVQFFAEKQSASRADLVAARVIEPDVIDVEAEPIEAIPGIKQALPGNEG
jgi:hypothetical protein